MEWGESAHIPIVSCVVCYKTVLFITPKPFRNRFSHFRRYDDTDS